MKGLLCVPQCLQGGADYLCEPRAGNEQDVGRDILGGTAGCDSAKSVVVDEEIPERIKDHSLHSLKDAG